MVLLQIIILPNADAITIFIDGMSTENTVTGMKHEAIGQREPYLIKSPLATELKVKDPKQVNLPWTGDISNIKEWNDTAVEDLKNLIKVFKASPKTKDEPINIVSHSFGTVIATRALEELQSERPELKINSLTTMGSPLGDQPEIIPSIIEKFGVEGSKGKEQLAQVLKQALPEPKPLSNVNDWTNVWADLDNISGQIKVEGVKNIQIDKDKDAIAREKDPRIKSVDVWHEAYYKGVHIGEINWDIPKDYSDKILPPIPIATTASTDVSKPQKPLKEKIKETIKEKISEFIKKQVASSIMPLAKGEPVKIIKMPGTFPMGLSQGKVSDASKLSDRNVGYVNNLDNVVPQLVGVSYTSRSISFTFNEPMDKHFHTQTSGFGAGISCCTESWSSNRKTYTQRYSGNFYPSGSIVTYTINPDPNVPPGGKFNDLSGNPAPTQSGSFVIP